MMGLGQMFMIISYQPSTKTFGNQKVTTGMKHSDKTLKRIGTTVIRSLLAKKFVGTTVQIG